VETEGHAVGVRAAIFQRQTNRLLDDVGRVIAMQFRDTRRLPNAASIWPLCPQTGQQMLLERWPARAPVADGLGMFETPRALFQQGQVMQGVGDVLLPTVAAGMVGDHLVQVEGVHPKRIALDHQIGIGVIGGHRVVVGVEYHLAVGSQPDRHRDTTFEIPLWERPQGRASRSPTPRRSSWPDRSPAAGHRPGTAPAGGRAAPRRRPRGGWAPRKPALSPSASLGINSVEGLLRRQPTPFSTPPFSWAWGTEVTLEQVVAAKDDERVLFLAVASFSALHSRFQVIIADAVRHPLKVMERPHVPFEARTEPFVPGPKDQGLVEVNASCFWAGKAIMNKRRE